MKSIVSLCLATGLLLGSSAFAQTSAPNTQAPQPMQAAPPSSDSASSGSSTATTASPAVLEACKKEAMAKKLTGDDKTKFMQDCKAGKTAREGR